MKAVCANRLQLPPLVLLVLKARDVKCPQNGGVLGVLGVLGVFGVGGAGGTWGQKCLGHLGSGIVPIASGLILVGSGWFWLTLVWV